MNANKPIEIVCPACGRESLLKRTPRYEGFKRVGEDLNCAECGHVFEDENAVPYKHRRTPHLFDPTELGPKPEVFKPGEASRLCRHCAHYVVNPFIQRCALHKKEVEATDSCPKFKPREQPK